MIVEVPHTGAGASAISKGDTHTVPPASWAQNVRDALPSQSNAAENVRVDGSKDKPEAKVPETE